jgi:restriction system protein
MTGLVYLLVVGVVVLVIGVVGFFVFRHLIRKSGQSSSPPERKVFPETSSPAAESVVEKLRAMDWYQFEKVVDLIYQSQGYALHRRGGANPDGGIDLIIEKNGERAAVQCKRWKKWKVDVPKVRELFGAMTHEGISRGVIVALNGFTLEAKQHAIEHNIDIVHDENLSVMIAGLSPDDQRKVVTMLNDKTKHCPKCEAVMTLHTPKAGKNWSPFWGCSRYPRCHGKLQDD